MWERPSSVSPPPPLSSSMFWNLSSPLLRPTRLLCEALGSVQANQAPAAVDTVADQSAAYEISAHPALAPDLDLLQAPSQL